jgi:predicted ester cyclase
MSDRYETIAHRWFEEVWNKKREEAIDEMMHEDCVAHGLNDGEGNPLRGPSGFKTLFFAFIEAYPDLHVTVEETVSEGDKIAARCRVTGTHSGEGIGVAPTQKSIEFTGLVMIHVRDGKFIEGWNQFDFMNMYQQLGVLSLTLG